MLNSKKFYFILIGIVISLSIISFIVTFVSINLMTENNIHEFRENIITQKKSELEDRVNIVYKIIEANYKDTALQCRMEKSKKISVMRIKALFSIITAYYQKHKNDKFVKEDIKLIIKNATFNKNKFYFWVSNIDSKMILDPVYSELEDRFDYLKKSLFGKITKVIQSNDEGFIDYFWINPKSNKPERKISYIRLFEPLNWVIGTGMYLTDNTRMIQNKTLEEIKNATFGKNGYFWVNNMSYKMIMHPIKPEYDGKVFINTPKVPFVELGVDALKKSDNNFAFISYKFYDPATKTYENKLSIVKLFKPWNWVIGTGVYLIDVDKSIQKIKSEANKEIKKIIEFLMILNVVVIFLILFISRNFLDKYEELATKDKLTNIYNRLRIDSYLTKQIELVKSYETGLSLIFFDIDHFKNVNDTYGHKAGDYVLQEIAEVVSSNIRKSDFFGRWGGEEFLIILSETGLDEAYKVAEKLRKAIENHNFKTVGKITCSFGVAKYIKDETSNQLIERVDKLLYKAKESGRNRVIK